MHHFWVGGGHRAGPGHEHGVGRGPRPWHRRPNAVARFPFWLQARVNAGGNAVEVALDVSVQLGAHRRGRGAPGADDHWLSTGWPASIIGLELHTLPANPPVCQVAAFLRSWWWAPALSSPVGPSSTAR